MFNIKTYYFTCTKYLFFSYYSHKTALFLYEVIFLMETF